MTPSVHLYYHGVVRSRVMRPGPRFIKLRRDLPLFVINATSIYGAQLRPFHKDRSGFVYAGVTSGMRVICVNYQMLF